MVNIIWRNGTVDMALKRNLLALVVVFVLSVAVVSSYCFADVASDLTQAQEYVNSQQYTEAETVCNGILSGAASLDEKMHAQKILACAYIKDGRLTDAQSAVSKLSTDYPNQTEMPKALADVAGCYFSSERHSEAGQLYTQLLSKNLQEDVELICHAQYALLCIRIGDFEAAQVSADKLLT